MQATSKSELLVPADPDQYLRALGRMWRQDLLEELPAPSVPQPVTWPFGDLLGAVQHIETCEVSLISQIGRRLQRTFHQPWPPKLF
jgi:hypothetical protein